MGGCVYRDKPSITFSLFSKDTYGILVVDEVLIF